MMDMRAGSLNPLRGCCTCTEGQGVCNGETVTVSTFQTREVFLRCAPTTLSGAAGEQAAKFYESLPRKLEESGVRMSDVVWERIFFRDAAADFEAFSEEWARWFPSDTPIGQGTVMPILQRRAGFRVSIGVIAEA